MISRKMLHQRGGVLSSQTHVVGQLANQCSSNRTRSCRQYASVDGPRNDLGPVDRYAPQADETPKAPLGKRAKQKEADREFFTHLLSSAAPKRDAKAYLSRLKSPTKPKPSRQANTPPQPRVNLGNLFGRGRAVEESPVFSQYALAEKGFEEQETLHVALIKIGDVEALDSRTLDGMVATLVQLNRLSMSPCVLVDSGDHCGGHSRQELIMQADELVSAMNRISENSARRIDSVFSIDGSGTVMITLRELLLRPLRRGLIPVIVPVAYSDHSSKLEVLSTHQAAIALTKEFAGLNAKQQLGDHPEKTRSAFQSLQKQLSLDRIITIDKAGGIPDPKSADGKKVFVNLEQEYTTVQNDLGKTSNHVTSRHHSSNLHMLQSALQLLPPESSGLMTTHEEAADRGRVNQDEGLSNVGTRRQKNALIHNLLTDKPAYSSSLPSGRLNRNQVPKPVVSVSTFVKRGMPVTILPDAAVEPWTGTASRLKLTDPRIDLSRLVYLIEDSFNRKLDVEDYLRRVNDRIAGVIIAGEYEGGALLTWETPPGTDAEDTTRLVPYLDKFAVLKRSQGAGGVADLVFNAMVRTCFPNGVCWRSRKDNPVNKWYFERSRGTWKIPDMNWTMFWTTAGVDESSQLFSDYEGVCRGVVPSWADKKKAAD